VLICGFQITDSTITASEKINWKKQKMPFCALLYDL
jgi:hypothetical protein